jgi:5-methylcytosine-specific restriction endonuclease McrA
LQVLRNECWVRDKGCCVKCGVDVWQELPHTSETAFHMAHIKAKRMGGDTLENVETLCGDCHRKYHNYGPSMEKPCKAKS